MYEPNILRGGNACVDTVLSSNGNMSVADSVDPEGYRSSLAAVRHTAVGVGLVLLVIAIQASTTSRMPGTMWEEAEYVAMASSLTALSDQAPMAYRLIPAKLVAALPVNVSAGFEIVNWSAIVLTIVGLVAWLRLLGVQFFPALVSVAMFMATFTVKSLIWWRYGTDTTGWALLMLALIASEKGLVALTAFAVAIGSLAREVTLFVIVVLIGRLIQRTPKLSRGAWAAVAVALSLPIFLRVVLVTGIQTTNNYSYAHTAIRYIHEHLLDPGGLARTAMLLPTIYGALLWPIALDPRGLVRRLRARWDLTLYSALVGVAGLVGGPASDRVVFATFPIVLWLFANSAALPTRWTGWVFLVAAQLVLMEVWLSIADAHDLLNRLGMLAPSLTAHVWSHLVPFLGLGALYALVRGSRMAPPGSSSTPAV
jgi:hypothetical protein